MDTFYELLDGIDKNIEEHCNLATRMIQDHDWYANVLLAIKAEENNETLSDVDKEEIHAILDRLQNRLHSVSIGLVTHRNESQTQAVEKVNEMLNQLVEMVQNGSSDDALKLAESYLNDGTGSKFEALLLSCTSDDQKAVKKRIKNIMDNMNAIMEDANDDKKKAEQIPENSKM